MEDFIKYMQIIQEENEKSKQNLMTIDKRLEMLLEDVNKRIDDLRTVPLGLEEDLDSIIKKEITDFTEVAQKTPISSLVMQEADNNMLTEMTQKMLQESISQIENTEMNQKSPEQADLVQPKSKDSSVEKKVTNVFLDEKIIQLCKEKSVKPKTKIKKKAKKKNLNVTGFIWASSLAIAVVATPIAAHAINMAYPNQMIEEATENYMENIFNPNTEQHFNSEKMDTDHYHDLINIMVETKEEYENPIVGFYLVYNNLDKYCQKYKLDEIFYNFNLVYKTDYTSLEDFLQKNNFKNRKEFEEYVGYELSKLSTEERGRGM